MNGIKINIDEKFIEFLFGSEQSYKLMSEKLILIANSFVIMDIYRFHLNEVDLTVRFSIKDSKIFLYECCEELLYYLFSNLRAIDRAVLDYGLRKGINILNSKKFLFMIPNQRKFLIDIKDKYIILMPIHNEDFCSNEKIYEYYKNIFAITMQSLEGFVRSRLEIDGKKIRIEYYDAIDQFFYIMRRMLSSPKLFDQNFSTKEYLNSLARFIIKHTAIQELKKLDVECNYDHPLNDYRYLTLMTYKLFSKLSYNGAIENLDHNDVMQLADAMTYENNFEKMPNIIADCYSNLNKVLPFKTLEKILKRQKNVEYYF
jgi:hypothetical protein